MDEEQSTIRRWARKVKNWVAVRVVKFLLATAFNSTEIANVTGDRNLVLRVVTRSQLDEVNRRVLPHKESLARLRRSREQVAFVGSECDQEIHFFNILLLRREMQIKVEARLLVKKARQRKEQARLVVKEEKLLKETAELRKETAELRHLLTQEKKTQLCPYHLLQNARQMVLRMQVGIPACVFVPL
jgi:hypothetical protein